MGRGEITRCGGEGGRERKREERTGGGMEGGQGGRDRRGEGKREEGKEGDIERLYSS